MGHCRHGQLPCPDHVDVEDASPHVGGGGLEVVVGDHRGGAGIVDQDVESTVGGDDLLDQAAAVGLVGHVGLDVGGVGSSAATALPASTEWTS